MKPLATSVLIGTALTLALFGLGYAAAQRGLETLSYGLYWQAYVLYLIVPCAPELDAVDGACHTLATGKLIFYGGLPLGVAIYSGLAWGVLRLLRRRPAVAPGA